MKTIEGLNFQPWIGKNYENSSYGKLLLLGESHYLDGEANPASDFTTEVVKNHLQDPLEMKTSFFRTIQLIFNQNQQFWDDIAFANLIQNGLENWQSQPSADDRNTIKPSFKILLNTLKPKKVIVLSKRLWNYWIPEDNGKYIKPISAENKSSTIWEYKYIDGNCLAIGINHPSRIWGNAYQDWAFLVKRFLSMKL